jgi:hypothetical protein
MYSQYFNLFLVYNNSTQNIVEGSLGLPRVGFGDSKEVIYIHQSSAKFQDERCLIRTKLLPVV